MKLQLRSLMVGIVHDLSPSHLHPSPDTPWDCHRTANQARGVARGVFLGRQSGLAVPDRSVYLRFCRSFCLCSVRSVRFDPGILGSHSSDLTLNGRNYCRTWAAKRTSPLPAGEGFSSNDPLHSPGRCDHQPPLAPPLAPWVLHLIPWSAWLWMR